LENLDETGSFLRKYSLPKLTLEEMDYLCRPVLIQRIEQVDKNLPTEGVTDHSKPVSGAGHTDRVCGVRCEEES